jgi:uncharacterized iron-regulated protein
MRTFPRQQGGRSAALAVLLTALLSACASTPSAAPAPTAPPQVWLMGEVHDNASGHRQRYEALRREVEAGWRPALAMEQFDRETQAALSKAQKECANAKCVIAAMDSKRWDWNQYLPVIELALAYQLPLIAANLSRADASRTVREGVKASFDDATVQAYGLVDALPGDIVEAQQKEIMAGHCNLLPQAMADSMAQAQVARDIWMAKIIRAQRPRDVVLLAGNGHVRKDIGVGRWINAVAPPLAVRSEAYLEEGSEPVAGAFDVTHVVAPQSRPDPCEDVKPKAQHQKQAQN